MGLLLKNGKCFAENGKWQQIDLLICDGKIARIASEISKKNGHKTIDVCGRFLAPGFVDVHVHLRQPGGEEKETIATGTKAAACGGFTTVCAMPNTDPVPDTADKLGQIEKLVAEHASVRVLPLAAITEKEKGRKLNNFRSLQNAGAVAFSDDGRGVQRADMMAMAMREAAAVDAIICAHCEDETLVPRDASFRTGSFTRKWNIPGIPSTAESVHIARDLLLAEESGCRYHVCHVSTKESVRIIREAKRAGIAVSAEVTPHHLLLTYNDIPGMDGNYKMNPPLGDEEDRQALIEGLRDGTIDVIATDHAPHTEKEKNQSIAQAPFGIVGLETAFPLLYTELVKKGVLSLKKLLDCLTIEPCRVFRLPYGVLKEGEPADITVIDLNKKKRIDRNQFFSKGKNTPFHGKSCSGWPVMTIVGGKIVFQEGALN